MKNVLIFPAPFLMNNPTSDEQTAHIISSTIDEVSMMEIGTVIEVDGLDKTIYAQEIRGLIKEQKPDWVIASGESATACINLYHQKKILVNPTLTTNDLNNVPEYTRWNTYGFFGALPEQEKSYELFQCVYPHAAWFINKLDLGLIDIKDITVKIINENIDI